MSITELIPILHELTHTEKLQAMQMLLRDIAVEEHVEIEITEKLGVRPIGLQKSTFSVSESFFEPLPNELLNDFEGRTP